jgi:hypothetical protein
MKCTHSVTITYAVLVLLSSLDFQIRECQLRNGSRDSSVGRQTG